MEDNARGGITVKGEGFICSSCPDDNYVLGILDLKGNKVLMY